MAVQSHAKLNSMNNTLRVFDNHPARMQLISGRAYQQLYKKIADHFGSDLTPVELAEFANGEINCRIEASVRGNDVFVIQTHCGDVNQAIIEQLLIIDAAKRASASSITAVCPFLSYARQDRKSNGREPIGARLIINMLSTAGADRIMSVDLHSGQTQGFFDGPFDHLIAMPLLKSYIKNNFKKDVVIVSPDAGRVKLTERYSKALNSEMAIIHKQRSNKARNSSESKQLIGEVAGKTCLLIDDMIDTAGTICAAADLLKEKGAKEIYGLATHGLLSGPAYDRINDSAFKKVIVTDTVPVDTKKSAKLTVLSVAPLIADAITAVCQGGSVSAIFDGENQI